MTTYSGGSSLSDAANWLQAALSGPVATTIGVLAIAAVGFMMMSGRFHWRRGAWTVAGCFILFGAPAIAAGLIDAARLGAEESAQSGTPEPIAPPPIMDSERPQSVCWTCGTDAAADPYAGAALAR